MNNQILDGVCESLGLVGGGPYDNLPERVKVLRDSLYMIADERERYRATSEKLWDILDDIDTLSDKIKPITIKDYELFYRLTIALTTERHKHLINKCDELFLPNQ